MSPVTRRATIAAAVVAVAGGGVGGWRWLGRPGAAPPASPASNPATATVTRVDLSAREQVSGTMGYVGDWRIAHPGPPDVLTAAPPPATVVRRGQRLYEVDGRPVLLLYGARPVWREFRLGMAAGADVRQLEQNLAALGYTGFTLDGRFTAGTSAAVRRWQRRTRQPETGRLPMGSVVFAPDALRVVEALTPVGTRIGGGPVLRATSTHRAITVALPTDRQGQLRRGGSVEVTLPSGEQVTGRVSQVGRVATGGGGAPEAQPTISVTITLDQAAATAELDQAPVQVTITTELRTGVLAVPVTAVRAADAAGKYEIVVVDGGTRRALRVQPGLLDERSSLIEITGDGLAEGMKVEVPRDDAAGA